MIESIEKKEPKDYPSLYDAFQLGDRVKRFYKDKNGNNNEYKGIVLAIDNRIWI
jgi:ribosomal protein L19